MRRASAASGTTVTSVFEYHGWATVLNTAGCDDRDHDPSEATLDAIRSAISEAGLQRAATLESHNGSWF